MKSSKTKSKISKFAFEYLDGGCNEDINLQKNIHELRAVELTPYYVRQHTNAQLGTELVGHIYDAPFGISPTGLQGLVWPNAPEILAKAACKHNIPFILSTVSTSSIERIGEITEGKAWFQLYHPAEKEIKDKIISRVAEAGYPVLVILSDVPTFGYRPRDIRNGLAMPPRMTLQNILQIMGIENPVSGSTFLCHPETLYAGGSAFAFLGRSCMYAVAALGEEGGDHMIGSLRVQLKQVMDQICCSQVCDLKNHLIK